MSNVQQGISNVQIGSALESCGYLRALGQREWLNAKPTWKLEIPCWTLDIPLEIPCWTLDIQFTGFTRPASQTLAKMSAMEK
ncbi:MAG: hypothetical protein IPH31_12795 [Lewinellaceae bacterium]|nr:hypothetical protein [Lewinellaceae bacterium]